MKKKLHELLNEEKAYCKSCGRKDAVYCNDCTKEFEEITRSRLQKIIDSKGFKKKIINLVCKHCGSRYLAGGSVCWSCHYKRITKLKEEVEYLKTLLLQVRE